ncbi:MAG: hypothetical protein KC549_17215 [Myxococcales bacterium]|nr:hypothetical protein [Myxococcales bacterium]
MSERVQGVTALLGRTAWGPVDTPTVIHSEAGFAQVFGGASAAVGGAVRDLLEAGGPIVFVRLFNADDTRRRFETEVAIWGEAPWRRPVRAALSACLDGALGLPADELEQRGAATLRAAIFGDAPSP